jgi:hypothetical protein
MQLRFLLRNLTRFHHEHLVVVLMLENTSWFIWSHRCPLEEVCTTVQRRGMMLHLQTSTIAIDIDYVSIARHCYGYSNDGQY